MRLVSFAAALAVVVAPEFADACSVCSGGQDQSRTAFIVTTVFLSVLPPALVGGFVFWLYSRSKQLEQRDPVRALHVAKRT